MSQHITARNSTHITARNSTHLARVRVDDAHVVDAVGPLEHDLLHVLADDLEVVRAHVVLDHLVEELLHVAQQLL